MAECKYELVKGFLQVTDDKINKLHSAVKQRDEENNFLRFVFEVNQWNILTATTREPAALSRLLSTFIPTSSCDHMCSKASVSFVRRSMLSKTAEKVEELEKSFQLKLGKDRLLCAV